MQCTICGGVNFKESNVLWPQLIEDWQLSSAEVEYINRQQGKACIDCGANVRSMALANSIRSYLKTSHFMDKIGVLKEYRNLSVLELNGAGNLTKSLSIFPGYIYKEFPEVDMNNMPFSDNTFDMVIHSDSLEHIHNPVNALKECRRILKIGGALCFTVPVIIGRLSRSRDGLPKSYHGNSGSGEDDLTVKTEFGADFWTYVFEANFTEITVSSFDYPAGLSIMAKKTI